MHWILLKMAKKMVPKHDLYVAKKKYHGEKPFEVFSVCNSFRLDERKTKEVHLQAASRDTWWRHRHDWRVDDVIAKLWPRMWWMKFNMHSVTANESRHYEDWIPTRTAQKIPDTWRITSINDIVDVIKGSAACAVRQPTRKAKSKNHHHQLDLWCRGP